MKHALGRLTTALFGLLLATILVPDGEYWADHLREAKRSLKRVRHKIGRAAPKRT